jgi:DNA invertase Pin-like site-specific DNA recombinase
MPRAYSYIRFSEERQSAGDSVRRQTEARDAWLARHPKVVLDTSLKMTDAGVSAFRGKHRTDDRYCLGAFLKLVKAGRIERGSYLLIENLDRLGRDYVEDALSALLDMIRAGVAVVQLLPSETEFVKGGEPMKLMMAIMELSRGQSESMMKSERRKKLWASKRATWTSYQKGHLPSWFKRTPDRKAVLDSKGRPVPDAAAVATIRKIFRLCLKGRGMAAIAKELNDTGTPTFGYKRNKAALWSQPQVYRVLRDRMIIGEYQPHHYADRVVQKDGLEFTERVRQPVGAAVAGFYPSVVDDDDFAAAQKAIVLRGEHGRGRPGAKRVNIFAGLTKDARNGGAIVYQRTHLGTYILVPLGTKNGHAVPRMIFAADVFEKAVLSRLRELNPADLADAPADRPLDRAGDIKNEMAVLDELYEKWQAKMDNPAIVDTVAAKLTELDGKRKALADELAAYRPDPATPADLDKVKTAARSLAEDDSDRNRMRVRDAVRAAVESIHCLFVGDRRMRFAACRVQFRNSQLHRDYLILRRGLSDEPEVRSGLPTGRLDLRQPADAARVKAELDRVVKA